MRLSLTECLCACIFLGGVTIVMHMTYISYFQREAVVASMDWSLQYMYINSQVSYLMVHKLYIMSYLLS